MKNMIKKNFAKLVFFSCTLLISSLGYSATRIHGAGATFPYPLYSKWFYTYQKKHPSIQINYQSIGSGGGVRQLLKKTVHFGASDVALLDRELKKSKTPILHIPMVLGAVVFSYHLPKIHSSLHLSGAVLVDIYLGKITYWNHPKIQALNPKIKLPKLPIMVLYRSDGSGTTALMTRYLSSVSSEWKKKIGFGKSISWPIGIGAKGNEGVSGLLKQSPGAIGYLSMVYAKQNHLSMALLQNKQNKWIKPTLKAISKAAQLRSIPKDLRLNLIQSPSLGAYPIVAATYILIYQKMPKSIGPDLVDFLKWALTQGQSMASPLTYAPLPKKLAKKALLKLKQVTWINP